MTATAGPFAHDTFASDPSDPDGPIFRNSPPMTAYRPRLEPSLSPPPAIPLPKVQPSQGDAVLVHYLDGGRRPEIAAEAGAYPLDGGYCDDGVGGEEDDDDEDTDEEDEGDNHSRSSSMSGYIGSPKMSPDPRPTNGAMILKSLALAALEQQPSSPGADSAPKSAVMENDKVKGQMRSPPEEMIQLQEQQQQQQQLSQAPPPPPQVTHHPQLQPLQPRDMTTKPGLAMPITPYTPSVPEFCSPRLPSSSGLRHPDPMSPTSTPSNHGELAPIMASPTSETNGHTSQALPSIRAQVGDLLIEKHYPDKDNAWRRPSFPQSPPGLPGMSSIPGMTSPTSPQYPYTHSMPSPASVYTPHGSYPGSGFVPRSGQDYSGPIGRHPEAPVIMDHNNPLVSPVSRDRMSIDHMTNQVGSFVCNFAGCNAAPFQTQYLLNSHANVHSSARPHYCPVKGCPRSEGGKGFKRKNEMIRHGLVHESPGYVCPFCPDREHKYPRPDNLQRHVRVHHTDKDKDDPQLREVLAQRPDGPNRGRRRRGVP